MQPIHKSLTSPLEFERNFFSPPARGHKPMFIWVPQYSKVVIYISLTISFQIMWIVSAAFILQCSTYWTVLEGPWQCHWGDFSFDDLTPTCSSQVDTWGEECNSNLMLLMVCLICISKTENVNVLHIERCIRFINVVNEASSRHRAPNSNVDQFLMLRVRLYSRGQQSLFGSTYYGFGIICGAFC